MFINNSVYTELCILFVCPYPGCTLSYFTARKSEQKAESFGSAAVNPVIISIFLPHLHPKENLLELDLSPYCNVYTSKLEKILDRRTHGINRFFNRHYYTRALSHKVRNVYIKIRQTDSVHAHF